MAGSFRNFERMERVKIHAAIFPLMFLHDCAQSESIILKGFFCVMLMIIGEIVATHFEIRLACLRDAVGVQGQEQVKLVLDQRKRAGEVLKDELDMRPAAVNPPAVDQIVNRLLVGKEVHRLRILVDENDMREIESGCEVDGAPRVESFLGMILLKDELKQAASLEADVGIGLLIPGKDGFAVVHPVMIFYFTLIAVGEGKIVKFSS